MAKDQNGRVDSNQTFGELLKMYIDRGKGREFSSHPDRTLWTKEAFAGAVNVNPRTLYRWLNDKSLISETKFDLVMKVLFGNDLSGSDQSLNETVPALVNRFRHARLKTAAIIQAFDGNPKANVSLTLVDPTLKNQRNANHETTYSIEMHAWLNRLISMQYPWGEWADERTVWEGVAAERRPRKNAEGPKPNVARTLFALEILDKVGALKEDYYQIAPLSLKWLKGCISDGWFEEWKAIGYVDSDHLYPSVKLEKDIRHSAQSATMLLHWGERQDFSLVAQIVENLLETQLSSHFWPENPQKIDKRILATIYAVETFSIVLSDPKKGDFRKHIGEERLGMVEKALMLGLVALQKEALIGDGLLGTSFSGLSSYITGLALYRLARLSGFHSQMSQLVETLSAGLLKAKHSHGWANEVAPEDYAKQSIPRTTLRVLAGFSRIPRITESDIFPDLMELAVSYVTGAERMDAPDIACLIEALVNLNDNNVDLHGNFKTIEGIKYGNLLKWIEKFDSYLEHCETAREQNQSSSFDIIIDELKRKIELIDSDRKLLRLKLDSFRSA